MPDQENTAKDESDLDYVLSEVGEFGKFQIFHFILMILPIILASTYVVEYIVTSSNVDYRCKIPECDIANEMSAFDQPWIQDAIPFKNNRPQKCLRYKSALNVNKTQSTKNKSNVCPKTLFNHSEIVRCKEFIFKTDEHRITKEFKILCDENEFKLALVGTINNIGGFIFMPLSGLLSDKYGRLTVLILGMFGSVVSGLCKAFVGNYTLYMTFEFIGGALGTCNYVAAYVLCVEWVSSKNRVVSGTIIGLIYALGEILLGLAAMYFEHYRTFLLAIYAPGLLIVFYFWLVPESVRWLVVTGQHERALTFLQRTTKRNNTQLSNKSLDILRNSCDEINQNDSVNRSRIFSFFKHKVLIVRLIVCSMCWIFVTHIFYGLSVNATKIANDDNKYLSFIITMISEIPAAFINLFLLNHIGRRMTMCGALFTAGTATILSTFIPSHQTFLIRIFFFTGMCAASSAFAVLYIFSAEIWPTEIRNMLMNTCSMIGRFGSMTAPLTTLLGQYMPSLPLYVYGGTAIFSGFIIFLLPETKNKKLPDTIEEALKL